MSNFYKPHRHVNWNYGGPNWRLSRSKIDLFIECPRCFYIDNKLGTARPKGFPMNLNTAVDTLLKKEFDFYRAKKQPHPLMEKFNVDAVPFEHKNMDIWRDNFKGVEYFHEPTGMTVCGAVDDVWINKRGEVYVVDYKSTSKEEKVTLDADWQISYKRQMEIYQWLLRKNDLDVSPIGYFVYANGKTDVDAFNAKIEFDIDVIPYEEQGLFNEDILFKIKETLDGNELPPAGHECDYCAHFKARSNVDKDGGEDVII
jgi:CRISPR/Cas system-associated exonuclease Cas4 (RecB family)